MAEKIDPLKIARSSRDMDVKGLVGFFYAHQSKFWSWGPHNFVDVKGRGLRFNVQGHHHKLGNQLKIKKCQITEK